MNFNQSTTKLTDSNEIFGENFTVDEKILEIRNLLTNNNKIFFSKFLEESRNKEEIICVFLGILELIKLQEISVKQKGGLFGEIIICKKEKINNISEIKEFEDK